MEILSIFVLSLIFSSLIYSFTYLRRRRRPPGPYGFPFIGNLLQLDFSAPHIHLWKLAKKYGPIMSMKFGSVPVVVVSSSKLAKEVLKTQDLAFCSRPKLSGMQKLAYHGSDIAFAPYGQSWRELRKICVHHLLSNKQVQSFRYVREQEVFDMIKHISDSSERGEIANLTDIITSLMSTLIFKIAFGTKLDETDLDKHKFDELTIENQVMLGGFYVSDYIPQLAWVDQITGMISRLERVFKDMDGFYQRFIDSHLESRRKKSTDEDILDILIHIKEDESFSTHLTWDHIKGVLMALRRARLFLFFCDSLLLGICLFT